MCCTVHADVLTAIATKNMKQVQHRSMLLGMCPAGMCFPCPFTCDIWGSSPFRHVWVSGCSLLDLTRAPCMVESPFLPMCSLKPLIAFHLLLAPCYYRGKPGK